MGTPARQVNCPGCREAPAVRAGRRGADGGILARPAPVQRWRRSVAGGRSAAAAAPAWNRAAFRSTRAGSLATVATSPPSGEFPLGRLATAPIIRRPGGLLTMNSSIEALLDLQVIDKKRLTLKKAREQQNGQVDDAGKAAAAADAAVAAAVAEVERLGALVRQYTADAGRCDTSIADLRSQQMNAKTNKEYMAIINGIEAAKLEKSNREASIKELGGKIEALEAKAKAARDQAEALKTKATEVKTANASAALPTDEEQALQKRYDEVRATIEPAFLEAYERLVKANHKMPMMRIDPKSRSTAYGGIISHNAIEQIRMGKLVIDRGSNAILYLDERSPKKDKSDG
jgi:predicted  nucleic acid-binding Zn-ribbon protein